MEMDIFSINLDTVTTREVPQEVIDSISKEWEKLSSCYNDLENQYPEIRVPDVQEDEDPIPTEREVLYGDCFQLYVATEDKAECMVTKLRIQAVLDPVPALQVDPVQVTLNMKSQR